MNRTVRCLALFAIGVGAWACKGDPQSSLDRGTITSVTADPARIFVDAGATTPVLIDARDQLNQAVEITSVTEQAGTGISFARDFLFQPVFDASATDQASCDALANSSWTGAGCLVPRTNPTRLRYVITGLALAETAFQVTINGSNQVTVPVTVTVPTTLTGALSTVAPASGEDVTLTLPTGAVFDPLVVADQTMWQIVLVGGNSAVVSDLQPSVVTFQVAPNISGTVSAGPVVLPANTAVPPLTVTTSETFTSPQIALPLSVTLSSASITAFTQITVTVGAGLVFSQASLLWIADPGVGCPIDPTCAVATIRSRATDNLSIDATWPQGRTGSVYVSLMAAAGAPQFPTLNGETDQSLSVGAGVMPATLTQGLPPSGVGLEVVRLTLTDATLVLDPTATVTSLSGGLSAFTVAVDPAGQWIDYVPPGGSTATATVNGITVISTGLAFEFPASVTPAVAASTFLPLTTQAAAADITALLPAVGVSILWYDDLMNPGTGGDIFGNDQQFYNFTGPIDQTFVLDWNNTADVDILYADNPATVGFVCGGGATGAQPETSPCVLPGGSPGLTGPWTFVVNLYAGLAPSIMQLSITGN